MVEQNAIGRTRPITSGRIGTEFQRMGMDIQYSYS